MQLFTSSCEDKECLAGRENFVVSSTHIVWCELYLSTLIRTALWYIKFRSEICQYLRSTCPFVFDPLKYNQNTTTDWLTVIADRWMDEKEAHTTSRLGWKSSLHWRLKFSVRPSARYSRIYTGVYSRRAEWKLNQNNYSTGNKFMNSHLAPNLFIIICGLWESSGCRRQLIYRFRISY